MTEDRSKKCFIGTSGWNYKHWSNGRFYPPKLAVSKWLAFYAQHYNTVEINNSFYRIPAPESMDKWMRTVPPHFKFAVKLWRGITHYRKLKNTADLLERFFEFANVLKGRKRGPLLIQLPPNLKKDVSRLDDFLNELHEVRGKPRWLIAVEFRHPDWLADDVYRLLDRHRAAIALVDGRVPATEPNDVNLIYIRRHAGPVEGRYGHEHIQAEAKRIRKWLNAGKTVYVYYNNDWGGHAVDNAKQLMDALGLQFRTRNDAMIQGP